MPPDPNDREGSSDTPPGGSGRPGASHAVDSLRAVTIGSLLVIGGGLLLDAAPTITADQRVIVAGLALLLAALLGLSAGVYRGRS